MSEKNKLSLTSAIFININIMLGTGIFINAVNLTEATGSLGAAVYAIVGILILPLILVFSQLLKYHPAGTFYEFGKRLNPLFGFISSWTYFTGKLATAALGIHIFVILMQKLNPLFATFNPLLIDTVIIFAFVAMNMLNIKTGRTIQYVFVALKFIPITFVIASAFVLFSGAHFTKESLIWEGIPGCVPFVLFAFAGFEASCSLSKSIINPKKNGPRAIIISYIITLVTVISYQLGFFGMLGSYLGTISGFRETFPVLISKIFPNNLSTQTILKILTLTGIAASSLGASYGVIYSNIWNLHALATYKHTFFANIIKKRNQYNTPFIAVLIAGFVVLCHTWFSLGNQISLQQIAAMSVAIPYTISMISFAATSFLTTKKKRFLAVCALMSCALILRTIVDNALRWGAWAYLIYAIVIFTGIVMFYWTRERATAA